MMAWGGICAEEMVALNLEAEHKTVTPYPTVINRKKLVRNQRRIWNIEQKIESSFNILYFEIWLFFWFMSCKEMCLMVR